MDTQLSYPGYLFFYLLCSTMFILLFLYTFFSIYGNIAKKSNLKTRCQKEFVQTILW